MKNKTHIKRSGIGDHRLHGKELRSPFSLMMPRPTQVFWARDLLPEFLWIDSLIARYGDAVALNIFNTFLQKAEQFNDSKTEILTGLVSSFNLINRKAEFCAEAANLIEDAVISPFGHVVSLYPKCAMAWLVGDSSVGKTLLIDNVRAAIVRLLPGKDKYSARCRVFPLYRAFAQNKLFLASNLEHTIKSLNQYPQGDTFMTEALARSYINGVVGEKAKTDPQFYSWAEYFWKRNGELTTCHGARQVEQI